MYDYKISSAAKRDLSQIQAFIAKDKLSAAKKFIKTTFNNFEKLATFPHMGHERKDFTQENVLFWPLDRYLIIYQKQSDHIIIVRVLSQFRDIANLLT